MEGRANCPRGFDDTGRITTVSPLTLAGYSGEAAIPERSCLEGAIAPPRGQAGFVMDLWAWVVPA